MTDRPKDLRHRDDRPVQPHDLRDLAELARTRFPLVPRRKPICPPLIDRIRRVRHQADLAGRSTDESLLRAAGAYNLAALILSDCAMSVAARDLCWQQFGIYATSGPYEQKVAKLALQPLINLGRLRTRDGNGTAAYQIHHSMFHAAKSRATAHLDGREVDLATIVRPGHDHSAVVHWLWTILLADGLRALCRAGRWSEAVDQARGHQGIGDRLLDGRQIAIIAHSAAGDHAEALRLINTTRTPAAWEQAVAACMTVFCRTWAGWPTAAAATAMRDAYLRLDPDTDDTIFHIRLGLIVAGVATNSGDIRSITHVVEDIGVESSDAYAAHDILTYGKRLPITERGTSTLRTAVRSAGIGTEIPVPLLHDLMVAVRICERALRRAIGHTKR